MPTSPVRGVKRATNVVSRPTVQVANSRPKRAPAEGEQRALGEQLAHEAPASGAERGADGELAVPPQQPREREVRHVGARDQQHQAGRPEQISSIGRAVPRHLLAHAAVVAVKPEPGR
jgi:hypothetical protein